MATTKPSVAWQPNAGPQTWLVTCPVADILCGGARGGGKTFGMIGCWLQKQAMYGKDAKGVWFRRSIPEGRLCEGGLTADLKQWLRKPRRVP